MKPLTLALLCTGLTGLALAQTPPADGLVSPEVNADRTATFRVRAPKATEVSLYGDWMPVGKPQNMKKDADGVWSIKTEPLEPTGHLYWFNLDGLAIADPINPVMKLRQRTSASLVEIPTGTSALWDVRDVPHGSVVTDWQKSSVLNRTERVIVYLPPGYDKGNTRYPVLYLVHGSGDIQESWVQAGHANLILDNLIAEGKAKPMIVVMPAGHSVPFSAGRGGPVTNNDLFEQYLIKEVIPGVDAKYRTAPGAKNRALAGLSMGGGHTIQTGFSHPDMFSALGVFSSAPQGNTFETKYKSVLDDAKGFNSKVSTVWLAGGDIDPVYPRMKAFSELLEKSGIHAPLKTYKGAHTWPVWRYSLTDFAPIIFNGKK
ncbi:MAG: putative esterase [Bryobacterales bacterium]|nr:putative esterase [Bryobacterales bacterium]